MLRFALVGKGSRLMRCFLLCSQVFRAFTWEKVTINGAFIMAGLICKHNSDNFISCCHTTVNFNNNGRSIESHTLFMIHGIQMRLNGRVQGCPKTTLPSPCLYFSHCVSAIMGKLRRTFYVEYCFKEVR